MPNGADIIAELQEIAAQEQCDISQKALNRLSLKALTSALIGIDKLKEDIRPLANAYKGTVRLAWTLGISFLIGIFGFLWALWTHAISIVTYK